MRFLIVMMIASALGAQTPGGDGVAPASSKGPAPSNAPAAPSGNAQNGRKLFVSYGCYQCHGREAQGWTATGPRLGPRPLPYAAFSQYVRRPTGQMPPYTAKVVPDQDLADMYAFLQSLPQPPPAKSIPLLNN